MPNEPKPGTLEVLPALAYSRYPMWLDHPSRDPVIVYSAEQEEEYRAKGFVPPGSADPHAYLISKLSPKLDDAIREMNERMEAKLKAGLADLYAKLVALINDELGVDEDTEDDDPELAADFEFYSGTQWKEAIAINRVANATKTVGHEPASPAMDAVREIAKGTRYDG